MIAALAIATSIAPAALMAEEPEMLAAMVDILEAQAKRR